MNYVGCNIVLLINKTNSIEAKKKSIKLNCNIFIKYDIVIDTKANITNYELLRSDGNVNVRLISQGTPEINHTLSFQTISCELYNMVDTMLVLLPIKE